MSESRKDIAKFPIFRTGSGLVKQVLSRPSRMMGNYHVRFLGGERGSNAPDLPDLAAKRSSLSSHYNQY